LVVWPVLADSPTLIAPASETQQRAVDDVQALDVDIDDSLGSETDVEPQLTATPPRPIVVKLEGAITARPATKLGEWQIDETIILVTIDTVILPYGYEPKVGDHAIVKALRTPSSLVATKITVENPGQPQLRPVEFRGIIHECIETAPYWGNWMVARSKVSVTEQTEIVGTPQTGLYAHVRGLIQGDGTVAASYIEILNPQSMITEFQFKGLVQFIVPGRGWWIIGGVPGEVTRSTEIIGQEKIKIGSLVEVNGQRSGLRIVFTRIALVEESTPVYWEGVIQQAAPESFGEWVIGDKSILVDEATFVDESHGRAQPGMWAQVTATQIDGIYRAVRIRIEQP